MLVATSFWTCALLKAHLNGEFRLGERGALLPLSAGVRSTPTTRACVCITVRGGVSRGKLKSTPGAYRAARRADWGAYWPNWLARKKAKAKGEQSS